MPNEAPRARALGVNHVVLEVGDLDAALDFYGQIFQFTLRGRRETAVFIDLGDQFLQFSLGKTQDADERRHFGLVVDDRAAVRARLDAMGVEIFERLNFRDPWGNRVEVVPYDNIQFTKAPAVLAAMGAGEIAKTPAAMEELRAKGMWREDDAP